MDILKVLGNTIHASMQENIFEINSILSDPTRDGAIDKLAKNVQRYSNLDIQLQLIQRLSGEVDENKQDDNSTSDEN
jgi:hypothetical protein